MGLDKILQGLQQPLNKDDDTTSLNRDLMGEYLRKKNEPIIFPPYSVRRFRKDKEEKPNEETNQSPTE